MERSGADTLGTVNLPVGSVGLVLGATRPQDLPFRKTLLSCCNVRQVGIWLSAMAPSRINVARAHGSAKGYLDSQCAVDDVD